MHGKREGGFVIAKTANRAIALMHIDVDDQGSLDFLLGLELSNSDGDIGKDAESFA